MPIIVIVSCIEELVKTPDSAHGPVRGYEEPLVNKCVEGIIGMASPSAFTSVEMNRDEKGIFTRPISSNKLDG